MKITETKKYYFTFDENDARMVHAMYKHLFADSTVDGLLDWTIRSSCVIQRLTVLNLITKNIGMKVELSNVIDQFLTDLRLFSASNDPEWAEYARKMWINIDKTIKQR